MAKLNWQRVTQVAEEYVPYNKGCFKKKKINTKPQTKAQKKRVTEFELKSKVEKEVLDIPAIGKCTTCLSFNLRILFKKDEHQSEVQCQSCKTIFVISNWRLKKVTTALLTS